MDKLIIYLVSKYICEVNTLFNFMCCCKMAYATIRPSFVKDSINMYKITETMSIKPGMQIAVMIGPTSVVVRAPYSANPYVAVHLYDGKLRHMPMLMRRTTYDPYFDDSHKTIPQIFRNGTVRYIDKHTLIEHVCDNIVVRKK